uniref:THAP-type domain-containing protein n=1 Tax=Salarias fasciatus TaxID=181472 RepID=A0A672H884_SALFA
MVKSCCVVGCTNNKRKNPTLSFYMILSECTEPERRRLSYYTYVCSAHFISGLYLLLMIFFSVSCLFHPVLHFLLHSEQTGLFRQCRFTHELLKKFPSYRPGWDIWDSSLVSRESEGAHFYTHNVQFCPISGQTIPKT